MRYLILLLSLSAFAAEQTFTATGSWQAPTGVTSVTVECWGGGGAGGSARQSGAVGGGGGGGAYVLKVVTVTPGNTYTVTVGATQSTSGGNGNDSWFSTSGTVIAQGGRGGGNIDASNGVGTAGNGGSDTVSIGDTEYVGGNGAQGTAGTNGGGGGGAGRTTAAGGNATGGTAGTSTSPGGAGGNGAAAAGAGSAGNTYGGGGGGGRANNTTTRAGGSGAAGYVRLTWTSAERHGRSVMVGDE